MPCTASCSHLHPFPPFLSFPFLFFPSLTPFLAVSCIRSSIRPLTHSLNPTHPSVQSSSHAGQVALSLNNLAALLRKTGRQEEAEQLYRRALSIHEDDYGVDHPQVKPCDRCNPIVIVIVIRELGPETSGRSTSQADDPELQPPTGELCLPRWAQRAAGLPPGEILALTQPVIKPWAGPETHGSVFAWRGSEPRFGCEAGQYSLEPRRVGGIIPAPGSVAASPGRPLATCVMRSRRKPGLTLPGQTCPNPSTLTPKPSPVRYGPTQV